jgi:hypothetical protein
VPGFLSPGFLSTANKRPGAKARFLRGFIP